MTKKVDLKTFLTKNLRFILLGLLLLAVFHSYIVQIVLMLMLAILGVYSLRVTRMVPHISVETISASAILFGYLYGWQVGLAFGVIVGIAGYIMISLMKLTTIVNALFMGLCGVLAALFHNLNFSFQGAFIVSFTIRAFLGYPTFSTLNPGLVENIMHSFGDALFNIAITMQIMTLLYGLILILT
ncbi:hypothetical protein JW930_01930 [Candidatus Woesearchaeota archaeon]|nr:hypothetical protein [Candidatus Woesearchaeota archaeon]